MDDDRGLCRSSANLKTVYEGTESLGEPQVLGSKPVQQALAALQRSLHISLQTASQERGRLRLPDDVPAIEYLSRLLQALRLNVLPITAEIAVLSRSPLFQHGDPADRLIAATALHGRWPLITGDEKLRALPALQCIW